MSQQHNHHRHPGRLAVLPDGDQPQLSRAPVPGRQPGSAESWLQPAAWLWNGAFRSPTGPMMPAWPVQNPEADFVPVGPWNTDGLVIANPLHSPTRSAYIQQLSTQWVPILFIVGGETGPTILANNRGGTLWMAVPYMILAIFYGWFTYWTGSLGFIPWRTIKHVQKRDLREVMEAFSDGVRNFSACGSGRQVVYDPPAVL